MKILAIASLMILVSSCNTPDFKVGDCVQKPDSVVVWKVEELREGEMKISQDQNPQMEPEKSVKASGWIKTECL